MDANYLNTATAGATLALAHFLIALTPQVRSLSLTGIFELLLVGDRPPGCQQSTRSPANSWLDPGDGHRAHVLLPLVLEELHPRMRTLARLLDAAQFQPQPQPPERLIDGSAATLASAPLHDYSNAATLLVSDPSPHL